MTMTGNQTDHYTLHSPKSKTHSLEAKKGERERTMEPNTSQDGSAEAPHRSAPVSASSSASVQSTEAKHRRLRQRQQDEPRQQSKAEDRDVENTKRSRRRRARARRAERLEAKSSNSGGGSIMWTILMIGLVFSLFDVVYIMGFIERQNLIQDSMVKQEKPETTNNMPAENAKGNVIDNGSDLLADKGRIMDLLTGAGIKIDLEKDEELIRELPTWSEVTDLYGPEPVIYGLEECDRFQHRSDPADHFVSTAGTFNTGTNLMAELLIANCHMQKRMDKYGAKNRGVRWQVPW